MLRFALGVAGRVGFRSLDDSSLSGVAEGGGRGAAVELAGAGLATAGSGAAGRALSVGARAGCAAAPGAYTRAATEANPNRSPAAAAATIVQRERRGRSDSGALDVSETLDTNGASLSGALLGGGNESMTGRTKLTDDAAALLLTGVGLARSVTFSLALGGAGSLSGAGGGGGMLERKSGMCSDWGASPPRTTTAWRGGDFRPGRAMKPPRGVMASPESGESNWSSSGG